MKLSGTPPEEVVHAWEDVKAMFNGGTRKRMLSAARWERERYVFGCSVFDVGWAKGFSLTLLLCWRSDNNSIFYSYQWNISFDSLFYTIFFYSVIEWFKKIDWISSALNCASEECLFAGRSRKAAQRLRDQRAVLPPPMHLCLASLITCGGRGCLCRMLYRGWSLPYGHLVRKKNIAMVPKEDTLINNCRHVLLHFTISFKRKLQKNICLGADCFTSTLLCIH